MIDLTTVQLFEASPPLLKLNVENKSLQAKNSVLSNMLIVGGIIVLCYFGYKFYNEHLKKEHDLQNSTN